MASSPINWLGARLISTQDVTPDIRVFEIEPDASVPIPSPGSHIQVVVQIDGRTETRSYSTVGPCNDGRYRIAVKLLPDSRGGSAYMWALKPGARFTIAAARNHFTLGRDSSFYLLLAGGIGITPIYSMALALLERGARFRVLYAARTARDLAFADELHERLGDRLRRVTDESGDKIDLEAEIAALPSDGELYVCGPIGLLEAVKRVWRASGRPIERLRFETFGNSGTFASEPFTVAIPRLGVIFEVPANQTLLDALQANGVAMISDCCRGECGLCVLPILAADGPIDHRDVFFSDTEKATGKKLCTCVSRVAGGTLTLDTGDRAG